MVVVLLLLQASWLVNLGTGNPPHDHLHLDAGRGMAATGIKIRSGNT